MNIWDTFDDNAEVARETYWWEHRSIDHAIRQIGVSLWNSNVPGHSVESGQSVVGFIGKYTKHYDQMFELAFMMHFMGYHKFTEFPKFLAAGSDFLRDLQVSFGTDFVPYGSFHMGGQYAQVTLNI